jgi:hypothetical protein
MRVMANEVSGRFRRQRKYPDVCCKFAGGNSQILRRTRHPDLSSSPRRDQPNRKSGIYPLSAVPRHSLHFRRPSKEIGDVNVQKEHCECAKLPDMAIDYPSAGSQNRQINPIELLSKFNATSHPRSSTCATSLLAPLRIGTPHIAQPLRTRESDAVL